MSKSWLNIIFYIGLGILFTHELDAMLNHEWRVLPITNWLSDENGKLVFLFLHIPIFSTIVALVASKNEKVMNGTRIGISIFLILHALLHILYMNAEGYEFNALSSNILIFGGAAFGALYLIVDFIKKI